MCTSSGQNPFQAICDFLCKIFPFFSFCTKRKTEDDNCFFSVCFSRRETEMRETLLTNDIKQRILFCSDLTASHPFLGVCKLSCKVAPSLAYCPGICDITPHDTFCSKICDRSPFHKFCTKLCRCDPDQKFCEPNCQHNPFQSFCYDLCENDAMLPHCREICNDTPSFHFCKPRDF